MSLTDQSEDTYDDVTGLDRLSSPVTKGLPLSRRLWAVIWPKVAAVLVGLFLWQLIVWSGWKPPFVLPGPIPTLARFWDQLGNGSLVAESATTLQRAIVGYLSGVVIGTLVAVVITRIKVVRSAVSPLVSGLQTMPSAAWVPLGIGLFGLGNSSILFVTILGAAPAIAIGAIAGIDSIPPILLRAGRVLGASGYSKYRHVIFPAALPVYVTGLKQGWAFSWRSLMAAELIANVTTHPSLGNQLQQYRDNLANSDMIAVMIMILIIGLVTDVAFFGWIERLVLRRRGLSPA